MSQNNAKLQSYVTINWFIEEKRTEIANRRIDDDIVRENEKKRFDKKYEEYFQAIETYIQEDISINIPNEQFLPSSDYRLQINDLIVNRINSFERETRENDNHLEDNIHGDDGYLEYCKYSYMKGFKIDRLMQDLNNFFEIRNFELQSESLDIDLS